MKADAHPPASGPHIRPSEPNDLPALQKIRRAAFRPIFQSFVAMVGDRIAELAFAHADAEQARLLEEICRAGSAHRVLVATLDGALLGFVSFTIDAGTRIGEIGLNAVSPTYAGRGLGTRMYEHVLALMKEQGVMLATVSTGGDPSHAPARRAYEKVGFRSAIPSVSFFKLL